MKTNWIIALVIGIFLASCGTGQKPETPVGENASELPPSLRPDAGTGTLVQLTEKQGSELAIETALIHGAKAKYTLQAPAVVYPAPAHSSLISTPINGQINRIFKYEGNMVRKGEILFQIQSIEFGNMVSDYLQAHAEERFQRSKQNRIQQLVEETISAASELEKAVSEYERASAILRASYSRLKAIGVSDEEISQFTNGETITPLLNVHAPISGIVETVFVELGQSVNALEDLSRLLDNSTVLIRVYVSPDDARHLQRGDSAKVWTQGRQSYLPATIESVNPGMDATNRSVVANIIVETVNGWPKPGENLQIEVTTAVEVDVITIPIDAITYDGNQAVVFVRKDPRTFEKRNVRISEIRDRQVIVQSGLAEGEEIAISKVFSLKAISRYDIMAEE